MFDPMTFFSRAGHELRGDAEEPAIAVLSPRRGSVGERFVDDVDAVVAVRPARGNQCNDSPIALCHDVYPGILAAVPEVEAREQLTRRHLLMYLKVQGHRIARESRRRGSGRHGPSDCLAGVLRSLGGRRTVLLPHIGPDPRLRVLQPGVPSLPVLLTEPCSRSRRGSNGSCSTPSEQVRRGKATHRPSRQMSHVISNTEIASHARSSCHRFCSSRPL